MPPKYVKTIREEILYEYAKLISRSAFQGNLNYGFITDRFKALRDGDITVRGTIREWQKERELPIECVYCASSSDLQNDHLIPRSRGGWDESDNLVLSCRACNISRANKGVFEWLGLEKKDNLHRLIAGKYLKLLLDIHEKTNTLDIDRATLHTLCGKCMNKHACIEWGTEQELTCFCLESVF